MSAKPPKIRVSDYVAVFLEVLEVSVVAYTREGFEKKECEMIRKD